MSARRRTCRTCGREFTGRLTLCPRCRSLYRTRNDPGPTKPRRGHGFTINELLTPRK
jgi:hypothetical protein